MTDLLVVKDLHKTFRAESAVDRRRRVVDALRGVSLAVRSHEILGIVGESGSGKSTLARLMLHLDRPTSGSVLYRGEAVAAFSARRMRQFRTQAQIVFQDPHGALNPRIRIESAVAEGLQHHGLTRAGTRDRVAELLELVGIKPERMTDYPHEFSGGQKQRVVIARALAVNPELVILDEPVSSLDVSIQAQIINLLIDLKRKLNLTYVFISHDLNLIGYVSDRIAVMRKGEIVELARATTLLESPVQEYTRSLFSDALVYRGRAHAGEEI